MRNLLFLIFLSFLISCKPEIKKENRIQEDVTYLASEKLEALQTKTQIILIHSNFESLREKLLEHNIESITGIYYDL